MERGAWRAAVHRVAESRSQLSTGTHYYIILIIFLVKFQKIKFEDTITSLNKVIFLKKKKLKLYKWLLTWPFAMSNKSLTRQPFMVPTSLQIASSIIR